MKYEYIRNNQKDYTVGKMCYMLGVSCSGYYSWCKRDKTECNIRREKLKDRISVLFHEIHGQMAGSPTITQDLREEPEFSNVHRSYVALLMKEMGLRCKIQKKFVATTDSNHDEWIAGNLLNRKFTPLEPHRAIVGDITYIRVASRWVYLSVFIDLYSRRVVSWDLSNSLAAESTCKALHKYLDTVGYSRGLLLHSDRGIQYASKQFREILKSNGIIQSMSRKGNCWDNAVAESFFHTLKTRLIYHRKYKTKEALSRDLFWYIEIYYNRVRKHSANNWMTPEQKECTFYKLSNVA